MPLTILNRNNSTNINVNLALIGSTILFSTIKVGRLLFVCKFKASSTVHDGNQYNATDRKRQLEVDEGDGLREDGRRDEEGRASFWKNISLSEVIASGVSHRQKLCQPRSTQSGPVTYLTSQRTPPQNPLLLSSFKLPSDLGEIYGVGTHDQGTSSIASCKIP